MNIVRGRLGMLAGVGLGAALMYLLDPGRGGRRRALIRDKSVKVTRKTAEAIEDRAEDLRNRAEGARAEVRIDARPPTNHQLEERVRARLGHHVDHARSIEVVADSGDVTLRGVALRDELDDVLTTVRGVKGVRNVYSELSVADGPGDIPALQS